MECGFAKEQRSVFFALRRKYELRSVVDVLVGNGTYIVMSGTNDSVCTIANRRERLLSVSFVDGKIGFIPDSNSFKVFLALLQ